MKKSFLLTIACAILFAFSQMPAAGIKGKVTPPENAGTVWAITGTDTLKTAANEGAFEFADAKPCSYTIIVEAKAPYKNFVKEGVEVKEGEVVDLGSITLEK